MVINDKKTKPHKIIEDGAIFLIHNEMCWVEVNVK